MICYVQSFSPGDAAENQDFEEPVNEYIQAFDKTFRYLIFLMAYYAADPKSIWD